MIGCQCKVPCLRLLSSVMANTEVEDTSSVRLYIAHPSGKLEEDKLIQRHNDLVFSNSSLRFQSPTEGLGTRLSYCNTYVSNM